MRKQDIKTKQQKYKGSITVYAALSFMLIAQFIFTMLEVSRTIEVRKALQMNTESVLESIFANYCNPLWEEYRLLGTSVVNSDGDLSFNNVQAQLQNLTAVNLGGREKSLLAGTSLLTAKMTDANFEEFLLMTDDNGAVFQEVVCAYMKENLTYETARTIYDNLNDMKNAKDQYRWGFQSQLRRNLQTGIANKIIRLCKGHGSLLNAEERKFCANALSKMKKDTDDDYLQSLLDLTARSMSR